MPKKSVYLFLIIFVLTMTIANLLASAQILTVSDEQAVPYYSWKIKEEMLAQLKNKKDTIIFGDSTAGVAFDPKKLGEHVYNFSLSGTTPIEAYFFFKYMIENQTPPKNIILSYTDTHYRFVSANYWDQVLGFNSEVISRSDAENILLTDQENSKSISSYQPNKIGSKNKIEIPYYYDLAVGALKHMKPDFQRYAENLLNYYGDFRAAMLAGRGYFEKKDGRENQSPLPYCVTAFLSVPYPNKGTVQFYLKKLIELANKENIKVYIVSPAEPQSCFDLGSKNNDMARFFSEFKNVNLDYFQNPVPDEYMLNREHLNYDGAQYYMGKLKPLFDEII